MRAGLIALVAACLLGCDWFNPPEELTVENLSNNSGHSEHPQVACGPAGNTVVVWDDNTGGFENIVMVEKQSDGAWSAPLAVSQDSSGSRYPGACFDSLGNLHLVYQRYSPGRWTIMYRCRDRDGTWAQEETVGGTWAVGPMMSIGHGQKPRVAYRQGSSFDQLMYATRDDSMGWSTERVPSTGYVTSVSVCEVDSGRVLSVWGVLSVDRLFSSTRSVSGVWSEPVMLVDEYCYWPWPAVHSVRDSAFAVHTIPRSGPGNSVVVQVCANGWFVPAKSTGLEGGAYYSLSSSPVDGRLILAMHVSASRSILVYERGRKWRLLATAPASGLTGITSVAVSSLGVVHVVWPTHDPNNQRDIMHAELQLEPVAP